MPAAWAVVSALVSGRRATGMARREANVVEFAGVGVTVTVDGVGVIVTVDGVGVIVMVVGVGLGVAVC